MSKKEKSSDYKNGYGDCKADLLRMIKEALKSLNDACYPNGFRDPSKEECQAIRTRHAELLRLRSMVKALKPKE